MKLVKYPNLSEEKRLWKKGYKIVAGLDEAGRGPLAGPVVAAAVAIVNPKSEILNPKQYLNSKLKNSKHPIIFLNFRILDLFRVSNLEFRISEVKDSKQLSAEKREELYRIITEHPSMRWGIGIVSNKVIDKINILEATKLAMAKAVENFKVKNSRLRQGSGGQAKQMFLIIDGSHLDNPKLKTKNYKLIIKGDEKVFSCAAASILAKVTRDRIMLKYHKKYPKYRFDLHKGYGTKRHFKLLKKYGPCPIHRKTFFPVCEFCKGR